MAKTIFFFKTKNGKIGSWNELPAETLRQFPASVHGPQERSVPVSAEAHEELFALFDALEARHAVVTAGDRE